VHLWLAVRYYYAPRIHPDTRLGVPAANSRSPLADRDRSLSHRIRGDWPRTLDELEQGRR
jgi:hypothetical protein